MSVDSNHTLLGYVMGKHDVNGGKNNGDETLLEHKACFYVVKSTMSRWVDLGVVL